MKWSDEYLYWIVPSCMVLALLALSLWLVSERNKFKKELRALNDFVNRNNRDIAGLCSAAITIDERLTENEESIKHIHLKLSELKAAPEPANQPYRNVIQKVQDGAGLNELMQNFGLSRDEATLLIRLHGQKNAYE